MARANRCRSFIARRGRRPRSNPRCGWRGVARRAPPPGAAARRSRRAWGAPPKGGPGGAAKVWGGGGGAFLGEGPPIMRGLREWGVREPDGREATAAMLRVNGVEVEILGDDLIVEGKGHVVGGG